MQDSKSRSPSRSRSEESFDDITGAQVVREEVPQEPIEYDWDFTSIISTSEQKEESKLGPAAAAAVFLLAYLISN